MTTNFKPDQIYQIEIVIDGKDGPALRDKLNDALDSIGLEDTPYAVRTLCPCVGCFHDASLAKLNEAIDIMTLVLEKAPQHKQAAEMKTVLQDFQGALERVEAINLNPLRTQPDHLPLPRHSDELA